MAIAAGEAIVSWIILVLEADFLFLDYCTELCGVHMLAGKAVAWAIIFVLVAAWGAKASSVNKLVPSVITTVSESEIEYAPICD